MSDPTPQLHPAQNRGLRELYAMTRQLVNHWSSLSQRLPPGDARGAVDDGAGRARSLLDELGPLTESFGLYGFPGAQGVGVTLAGLRSGVGDRFLERGQALRTSVIDVQHVVTLLGFQREVAQAGGPPELAAFCERWEQEMLAVERAARRAAVKAGAEPDAALERLDSSQAGRAARAMANGVGAFGEWFDRRRGGR